MLLFFWIYMHLSQIFLHEKMSLWASMVFTSHSFFSLFLNLTFYDFLYHIISCIPTAECSQLLIIRMILRSVKNLSLISVS